MQSVDALWKTYSLHRSMQCMRTMKLLLRDYSTLYIAIGALRTHFVLILFYSLPFICLIPHLLLTHLPLQVLFSSVAVFWKMKMKMKLNVEFVHKRKKLVTDRSATKTIKYFKESKCIHSPSQTCFMSLISLILHPLQQRLFIWALHAIPFAL